MLNSKKFHKIYRDYLESGLTVKDFCSNQGLLPGKFFYWQNKLKDELPPKKGFVPIILRKEKAHNNFPLLNQNQFHRSSDTTFRPANESQICEISYPNGVSIKLGGCADLELIRSLISLNTGNHV
jgi:hypothetical protein